MFTVEQARKALEEAGLVEGLGAAEVARRLETGSRLSDTGQRMLAFYLFEMERGRLYQVTGHSSTAFYAEARLGLERRRTRELVATVRKNVTIDWTIRDNVRAQLRVYVKRILRKYGYPPDKQAKATETVLEQAEVLSVAWTTP